LQRGSRVVVRRETNFRQPGDRVSHGHVPPRTKLDPCRVVSLPAGPEE
jgi:hypothetical protein